jgi:alpha-beta hydrolase superfamily lysophospholipase
MLSVLITLIVLSSVAGSIFWIAWLQAYKLIHPKRRRVNRTPEATRLQQQGYGVLLFDLRNHGESEGNLTSLGLYEVRDVQAAVKYVLSRPEVNSDGIALLGDSMGAATVLQALPSLPDVKAVVAVGSVLEPCREHLTRCQSLYRFVWLIPRPAYYSLLRA